MKLCVISMSGGLDSTTLAYKAISDGYTVLPINIDYSQKNLVEKMAFQDIYEEIKSSFPDQILEPVHINLNSIMKTTLDLYTNLRDNKIVASNTGLEYYTPSRNLLFTTIAAVIGEVAAMAKEIKELRIGLGVHKHLEYKNYWDITPEFVKRVNKVLKLNDAIKVRMYAPYVELTKEDIIQDAINLKVPVLLTWTCYDPQETILEVNREHMRVFSEFHPCEKCEACVERQKAGNKVGLSDINAYVIEMERSITAEELKRL